MFQPFFGSGEGTGDGRLVDRKSFGDFILRITIVVEGDNEIALSVGEFGGDSNTESV